MKVFLFDKISQDVPSFGALPREGLLMAFIAYGRMVLKPIV